MIKVTFVEHSGEERSVEVQSGNNLMQAAVSNGVPGIDADCGGSCSCATCHVYVDAEWQAKMPAINPTEEAMLDLSPDRQESSRLACQIELSDEHDGLRVATPEFQF